MRYRPVKKPAPMPENPYHRIFTPMPSFEDLVRKAREEEKTKKKLEIRNEKLGIGGRVWQEAKTLPHRRKRIFENA